MIYHFKLF